MSEDFADKIAAGICKRLNVDPDEPEEWYSANRFLYDPTEALKQIELMGFSIVRTPDPKLTEARIQQLEAALREAEEKYLGAIREAKSAMFGAHQLLSSRTYCGISQIRAEQLDKALAIAAPFLKTGV